MKFCKIIFWLHLLAGVIAGVVILIMSVTGVLLAYERQILASAEYFEVRPADPRLPLNELVEKVRPAKPALDPSALTIQSRDSAPVTVHFGREDLILVDPHTGQILSEGAKSWREFFHVVEDIHRWLAASGEGRPVGKAITGACNAAFVFLALSGLWLWWPKRWTRQNLKAVAVPSIKLRGKARDWNWHNAIGLWCAPFLFLIALSGVIMSYPWATNLIYRLSKSDPPGQTRSGAARPPAERVPYAPPAVGFDALVDAAKTRVPGWISINLRLPQKPGGPVNIAIEDPHGPHVFARSMLTLDAKTAKILKWEPFNSNNPGRKIRSWVRPIHTGEAGGMVGQTVAMLASLGGVFLVWTGLALTWRRFLAWRR